LPWRWLAFSSLCLVIVIVAFLAGGEFAMLLAGAALASIGAVTTVTIYLLRPIDAIIDAAGRTAAGDFTARAQSPAGGPPGRLAEAFNRMADRVQAQMEAASQERGRLAAALNSSIDAVAALDRDGRILFANLGFERTFNTTSEAVIGQPLVWVLADERVLDAFRESRDRGQGQINLVERPGRRFLQVVTTPIAGGGDWNVLLVCHDLTDEKRTELVRRDFVANVSHELRTPLAAVKSVVETLQDGALEDPTVAREFLGHAEEEIDRLVSLVEELLELSLIESGEQPLLPRDTDVPLLLRDAVRRLHSQAQRAGVEVHLEEHDAGYCYVDATRLERAVINLLQNAIKFTPAGGSVTITARRTMGTLEIAVSDTGIGIGSDEIPRIFERFYKADHSRAGGGSGLGLALVKHGVEAQGGSVTVVSTPGEGSTFTISIPVPD
jgi:two-component system, OmpR family, phosphate regulon sensor histidine kinase PhoR